MSYRLDADLNLVGSGKRKLLDGKQNISKAQMLDAVEEIYKGSGYTNRGGFLWDLLATGVNMIKNGIEGKRWSDNTVFKGLGDAKSKKAEKTQKPKRKVSEYHQLLGKLMKKGMNMKQAQAFLKKNLKK